MANRMPALRLSANASRAHPSRSEAAASAGRRRRAGSSTVAMHDDRTMAGTGIRASFPTGGQRRAGAPATRLLHDAKSNDLRVRPLDVPLLVREHDEQPVQSRIEPG